MQLLKKRIKVLKSFTKKTSITEDDLELIDNTYKPERNINLEYKQKTIKLLKSKKINISVAYNVLKFFYKFDSHFESNKDFDYFIKDTKPPTFNINKKIMKYLKTPTIDLDKLYDLYITNNNDEYIAQVLKSFITDKNNIKNINKYNILLIQLYVKPFKYTNEQIKFFIDKIKFDKYKFSYQIPKRFIKAHKLRNDSQINYLKKLKTRGTPFTDNVYYELKDIYFPKVNIKNKQKLLKLFIQNKLNIRQIYVYYNMLSAKKNELNSTEINIDLKFAYNTYMSINHNLKLKIDTKIKLLQKIKTKRSVTVEDVYKLDELFHPTTRNSVYIKKLVNLFITDFDINKAVLVNSYIHMYSRYDIIVKNTFDRDVKQIIKSKTNKTYSDLF
jgi:hypothetical protein